MKFFGDRKFLKNVAVITLPIVIQNTISNFVGLLDNLMVGRCGTDSMNGVSIFSQLFFVFILCVWGSSCGAGIFTAQFFGKGDHKGVRDTFRIKLYLVGIATIAGAAVFLLFGEYFMEKFIHESDSVGDPVATMRHAKDYMMIMLIGMIPTALGMVYAGTLRDIGETSVPMKAGFVAVFVNLILNYLLIFGKFGFPELGVKGAAIATVVSRFVESGIMNMIRKTNGKEKLLIPALFCLFSLGGAVFGMGEEALPFLMILVPIVIAMGYDGVTAVLITYVATQIGFGTSWMNPFSVAIAQGIAGVPVFSGATFRIVMWILFTAVGAAMTMLYANKIRKDPSRSVSYESDAYFRDDIDSKQETDSVEKFRIGHILVLLTIVPLFPPPLGLLSSWLSLSSVFCASWMTISLI